MAFRSELSVRHPTLTLLGGAGCLAATAAAAVLSPGCPLRRRRFAPRGFTVPRPKTAAMAHDAHTDVQELAAELEQLVHEERQLSSVRRRLHEQIDNGFPNDVIVRREREISAQRRALHRRIDGLRHRLGPGPGLRPAL